MMPQIHPKRYVKHFLRTYAPAHNLSRSAKNQQTGSTFASKTRPVCQKIADRQRICATGRRKHRRWCQFRYFGSPMYLLGTKCDPISTKIGVKRTYCRLRSPNKYTFLFSAGFLLRTRQAPFLCCGQVAETPESLRKSGERRSGRRRREERRVSSGLGERGHPRPR